MEPEREAMPEGTPEDEPEMTAAIPESPPMPISLPESAPGSTAEQLRLLRDNLALIFRQVEAHGRLMAEASAAFHSAAAELRAMTELHGGMVAELDRHAQRLGTATLSLARLSQRTPESRAGTTS